MDARRNVFNQLVICSKILHKLVVGAVLETSSLGDLLITFVEMSVECIKNEIILTDPRQIFYLQNILAVGQAHTSFFTPPLPSLLSRLLVYRIPSDVTR